MQRWKDNHWLFTPEELERLPDGIELEDILGNKVIKGRDYIDGDTRAGHLAYGVRDPMEHELKELFMEMILRDG